MASSCFPATGSRLVCMTPFLAPCDLLRRLPGGMGLWLTCGPAAACIRVVSFFPSNSTQFNFQLLLHSCACRFYESSPCISSVAASGNVAPGLVPKALGPWVCSSILPASSTDDCSDCASSRSPFKIFLAGCGLPMSVPLIVLQGAAHHSGSGAVTVFFSVAATCGR